eukprot:GEMP01003410.1.p1 GENE.GEMP01003410.1~~GEMP01003410.1.p1  ORF type:complete len:635 (+),score=161.76 GEMP01003410.1:1303-3207(+)
MGRSRERRRPRSHRRSRSRRRISPPRRSRDRREKDRRDDRRPDRKRSRSASRKRKSTRREWKRAKSKSKSREKSSDKAKGFRFDSPPKEEEVARDQAVPPAVSPFQQMMPTLQQAMGVLNPQALSLPGGGQLPQLLQSQLGLPPTAPGAAPLLALQAPSTAPPMEEDQKNRMVRVSNLPPTVSETQLQAFLNQVAIAMKVNASSGDPIKTVHIPIGTSFAMVEFRNEEEAKNAEKLNGVELMNMKMKVEKARFDEPAPLNASLPGVPGATGIPGAPPGFGGTVPTGGGSMPTLADMMVTQKEREHQLRAQAGKLALINPETDMKLALVNIPRFVQEKAISELLGTFGKLKFYRLLSREEVSDENENIVFFEYFDFLIQNQAKTALQGLDLGKQKLSVMTTDEIMASGKLVKRQTLGDRIVPSRVLYLKNLVQADELYDEDEFDEIFNDVKLECECFGEVASMTIPRPHPGTKIIRDMAKKKKLRQEQEFKERQERIAKGEILLAIGDSGDSEQKKENEKKENEKPKDVTKDEAELDADDVNGDKEGEEKEKLPEDPPGVGYAFVEFADIEGASKAKKALNGRKFGMNEVAAEYFSEKNYALKDFEAIKPNTVPSKAENADGLEQPEEEHIEFIW